VARTPAKRVIPLPRPDPRLSRNLSGGKMDQTPVSVRRPAYYLRQLEARRGINYQAIRRQVFERDSYTCQYCGAKQGTEQWDTMWMDHIIPISKGGKTVLSNLITACARCNNHKRSQDVDKWLRRYSRRPNLSTRKIRQLHNLLVDNK